MLRCEGEYAKANPFRFSTKFTDDETGLHYYGYRYYSTTLGRWISKDPLEEEGGLNAYGYVNNNALTNIDPDGRFSMGTVLTGVGMGVGGAAFNISWQLLQMATGHREDFDWADVGISAGGVVCGLSRNGGHGVTRPTFPSSVRSDIVVVHTRLDSLKPHRGGIFRSYGA